MDEALGGGKGERITDPLGYRSSYYKRMLVTGVGKIASRVTG